MKKTMIIWGIIAVILVGGLTIVGIKITKHDKPYKELEYNLKRQAESLIGEYPSLINTMNKITIEDFTNNNYKIDLKVNNEVCDGYVMVEKRGNFYNYIPYIKCSNYQTKGFDKN